MFNLSKRSYDRLDGVKAILIAILTEAIKESPFDFGIPRDGGVRSDKRQIELYARGRSTRELRRKGINNIQGQPTRTKITWTLNSLHKPHKSDGMGYAFDIFAYVDGKATWSMTYLRPIAEHIKKIALEKFGITIQWGYDLWKKDGSHFQIQ